MPKVTIKGKLPKRFRITPIKKTEAKKRPFKKYKYKSHFV